MALGPVLSGDVESLQGTAARRVSPGRDADDGRDLRRLGGQGGDHDGRDLRHHDGQGDRDGRARQRLAGKGQGGVGAHATVVGSRPSESRELSVNLFPESEMGRQPSGAGGPARSFSPVPTVMVGEERNPFSAGVNPFWSEDLRRRVAEDVEGLQEPGGEVPKLPTTMRGWPRPTWKSWRRSNGLACER